MKFELNFKRDNISDDELLQDIRDVSNRLNSRKVSMPSYEKFGKFDSSTIVRRFISWNNAIELAGLEVTVIQKYTEQDLFENILNVWEAKGKQPSRRDLDDKNISSISSGAYHRRFNSWIIALQSFVKYMDDNEDGADISLLSNSNQQVVTKKPRDPSLRLRYRVLTRDNYSCKLCGNSPAKDTSIKLHIDHIIPWSKGGETTIENLQTLCDRCNLGKSDLL